MNESIEVAGLTFEVRRSPRRRTLAITVDRAGELVIHAPDGSADPELQKWAHSKLLWVHQKLTMKDQLAAQRRRPEFVSGESFSYLGRSYRLMIVGQQAQALAFDGRCFRLRRDARERAESEFRRWYVQVGAPWIKERAAFLAKRLGAVPARVEVRDLGFRWGSCGKNEVVFFNWKLLQLPVRLADYVIAHELTHLHQPHHGPSFWHALECALPDFEARSETLRRHARRFLVFDADTDGCVSPVTKRANRIVRESR